MEEWFLTNLKQSGPIITLLAFFIWRDYKRELAASAALQKMQEFTTTTLLTLLKTTTETIVANAEILKDAKEATALAAEFARKFASEMSDLSSSIANSTETVAECRMAVEYCMEKNK